MIESFRSQDASTNLVVNHFICNQQGDIMNTFANRNPSLRPVLWKFLFLTVTLILMTVLAVAPASAQATTTTNNFQTSIDIVAFVPCAAGGEGEYVFFSGTLHGVAVTTIDDTGTFHTVLHFEPQGIQGEGLTTGANYQWTGATQATYNGLVGYENTFINNYRLIGEGTNNNLLIHQTFHATVQPDGEVTVFVDDYSVECR
jgi:hypothetical protein